jgi:hypothetical protein
MRRIALLGAVLVGVALFASAAQATPFQVCVPEKASTAVDSPTAEGTCKAKFSSAYLPTQAEEETLQHVKYEASGIDGKPTLVVSGVNVQIDSGLAEESETNGEGNLVIGLQSPDPEAQRGSNNLVVSGGDAWTGYGGIVSGEENFISGAGGVVIGGAENSAEESAVVIGGKDDVASDGGAVVGGNTDTATGAFSAVVAGRLNTASGQEAGVFGGNEGKASGLFAALMGGSQTEATATGSSVAGGNKVKAEKELEALL